MANKEATKKIDDTQILKSEPFRQRSEKFLRAVTGDYENDLIFHEGMNKIQKNTVMINPLNDSMQEEELVKKIIGVRGNIAHEGFHKLFTDPKAINMLERKYSGKENKKYEETGRTYFNIVEDEAVDMAGSYEFPGLRPYISMLNQKAYDASPDLQEVEGSGNLLKAHQTACWQYATTGKTKGAFENPKLQELFEQTKPIIDEAKKAKNSMERMAYTDRIIEMTEELIEQANEMNWDQMENPKGDDCDKNMNSEGRETPQGAGSGQGEQEQQDQEQQQGQGSGSPQAGDQQQEGESQGKGDQSQEQQQGEGQPQSQDQQQGENGGQDGDQSQDSQGDQGEDNSSNPSGSPTSDQSLPGKQPPSPQTGTGPEQDFEEEMKKLQEEIEKEVEEMKKEMEQEKSQGKESEKAEKSVGDSLKREVKYGDAHKHIKLENHFNYDPKKYADKNRRRAEEMKPITRSIIRRIQNMIKHNEDEKRTGQVAGFLTQSQLWRKDGKIFSQRKDRNEEADLAILLLVDESGSMEDSNRYIWARNTATALAEVCEALNIPLAVLGHQARHARDVVDVYHYVSFEKPIKEQKANIENISPRHNTREGVSLKYAGEYLARQPQRDRLLIVISDGEPYHCDSKWNHFTDKPAEEDAKKVVKDLEKHNITTFGIAIGDGQDKIENIYKNFISIPKIEKLPQKLCLLMQKKIFK